MRPAAGLTFILLLLILVCPVLALDLTRVDIIVDEDGDALMKVTYSINLIETAAITSNYADLRQTVEDRFSEAIGKEATTQCISPTAAVYSIDNFADIEGTTYTTPRMNFEQSVAAAGDFFIFAGSGNAKPDTTIAFPDNTTEHFENAGIIPAVSHATVSGGEMRAPPVSADTMDCTAPGDLAAFKKPFAAVATGIAVAAIAGNLAAASAATTAPSAFMAKIMAFFQKLFGNIVTGRLSSEDVKRRGIAATRQHEIIFGFSAFEILAAVIGAIVFGISFTIAKGDWTDATTFAVFFIVSGIGLALHEMAHSYLAARYDGISEFKFWDLGTVIMLVTGGLFGLVFAKPYRTIISNAASLDKRSLAMIMLAGPVVSVVLAFLFLSLKPLGGMYAVIGAAGFSVNLLSAVYGLMPFIPMDGDKVYKWSRLSWLLVFVPVLVIYLLILFQ